MFLNWGFLVGEVWVLVIVAALAGVVSGWLIRGRRTPIEKLNTADADRFRIALSNSEAKVREQALRIATLEREAGTGPATPPATGQEQPSTSRKLAQPPARQTATVTMPSEGNSAPVV